MCKIRCHFRKILTNGCAKLNDCNHNSKFSYTFLFIPVNSYGVKVARVGCYGYKLSRYYASKLCKVLHILCAWGYCICKISDYRQHRDLRQCIFLPICCNKAIMEQSGKRYGADVGIPDAEQ